MEMDNNNTKLKQLEVHTAQTQYTMNWENKKQLKFIESCLHWRDCLNWWDKMRGTRMGMSMRMWMMNSPNENDNWKYSASHAHE